MLSTQTSLTDIHEPVETIVVWLFRSGISLVWESGASAEDARQRVSDARHVDIDDVCPVLDHSGVHRTRIYTPGPTSSRGGESPYHRESHRWQGRL